MLIRVEAHSKCSGYSATRYVSLRLWTMHANHLLTATHCSLTSATTMINRLIRLQLLPDSLVPIVTEIQSNSYQSQWAFEVSVRFKLLCVIVRSSIRWGYSKGFSHLGFHLLLEDCTSKGCQILSSISSQQQLSLVRFPMSKRAWKIFSFVHNFIVLNQ